MRSVKVTTFLSKEEELHLGTIIQDSLKAQEEIENFAEGSPEHISCQARIDAGTEAVRQLVESNVGLVYERAISFRKKYANAGAFEDVVQDGMTGLMTAVYKYDPTRNNKFSTVAYNWIMQSIQRGCNKTSRAVRLPENRIYEWVKIGAIMNDPENHGLTTEELDAKIMEELPRLKKKDLLNIRNAVLPPDSLNRVVFSGSNSTEELADFVGESNAVESSEDVAVRSRMAEVLREHVVQLPSLQRDVVMSSFDMFDDLGMSADEVCKKYKIKMPAYRSAQRDALSKLRNNMEREGISIADFL